MTSGVGWPFDFFEPEQSIVAAFAAVPTSVAESVAIAAMPSAIAFCVFMRTSIVVGVLRGGLTSMRRRHRCKHPRSGAGSH